MEQISVIDANDQLTEITLDGTLYYIHLSWNESANQWYLGLQDTNGTNLVESVSVVPNYALLMRYRREYMPLGDIIAHSPNGKAIERGSFLDGTAALYYITEADLIDIGAIGVVGRL